MWETQACILIFHVWSGIKFLFLWFACLIRLSLYTGCPSWRNRHHLSGLWTSGSSTLLCGLWWLVYFNGLHLINQNIAFLRGFFFPSLVFQWISKKNFNLHSDFPDQTVEAWKAAILSSLIISAAVVSKHHLCLFLLLPRVSFWSSFTFQGFTLKYVWPCANRGQNTADGS